MYITINGLKCEAQQGEYILQIARRNNIHIPTLCHSDSLSGQANCRLCVVEVMEKGRSRVVASCIFPVNEGMEVQTNSPKIREMRRTIIMLLAARVPENKELKKLCAEYGVQDISRFKKDPGEECILCGLCVRACDELGTGAISTVNRGITKKISTPFDEPSKECIGCGACAHVCPTGAVKIEENNGKRRIWGKEFDLVKCPRCGRHFSTREQLEYVSNKLEDKEENPGMCEDCRRKSYTEKFKDIYGEF